MYAEMLHGNFYEINLDRVDTELALTDAKFLMSILWSLLPQECTDGVSFDDWVASDDN